MTISYRLFQQPFDLHSLETSLLALKTDPSERTIAFTKGYNIQLNCSFRIGKLRREISFQEAYS